MSEWDNFCSFTNVDIHEVKKQEQDHTVELNLCDDLVQLSHNEETKKDELNWNEIWSKPLRSPREEKPIKYIHPNDPELYDENLIRMEKIREEYKKEQEFWKYVNGGKTVPVRIPTGYTFNTPNGKSRTGDLDYYDTENVTEMNLADPVSMSLVVNDYIKKSKWNKPIGEEYLAQRGNFEIHFDNPKGKKLTDKFEKAMNKDLNDAQFIADQIMPIEKKKDFVPAPGYEGKSVEAIQDENFDREKERNKKLAEDEIKRTTGIGLGTIKNNSVLGKLADKTRKVNKFPANVMKRTKDEVTPSISEINLRQVSRTNFNPPMTRDKFLNNVMLYNAQKKALMGQEELNGELIPEVPKFKLGNSIERRPEFSYGYGYYGVSGMPDKNGLPTEWFDDANRWLIPSEEDYESGKVPTVIVGKHIHGLANIKEIKKARAKLKEKVDKSGVATVYIKRTTKDESGNKKVTIYNGKKEEYVKPKEQENINGKFFWRDDYKFFAVGRSPYNGSYIPENEKTTFYSDKYKNLADDIEKQLAADSTTQNLILVRELARYNEPLADRVEWLKDNLSERDMNDLIYLVTDQLRNYRGKDPFALQKMTAMEVAGKFVVCPPKPANEKELNFLLKRSKDIYNIDDYDRTKLAIEKGKTVNEKVANLKAIRDLVVIPKKDDKIYQEVLKIMDKCTDAQKRNFNAFSFYKNFFKSSFKSHMDDFEEWFHNWWMKPRRKLTRSEYEKLYKERMTIFNGKHWNEMMKKTIDAAPVYNDRMNKAIAIVNKQTQKGPQITDNSTLTDIMRHFTYQYNDMAIQKSILTSPMNKKFFGIHYDPKKFDAMLARDNANHTIVRNYEKFLGEAPGSEPDFIDYDQAESPEKRKAKFIAQMMRKAKEMPIIK